MRSWQQSISKWENKDLVFLRLVSILRFAGFSCEIFQNLWPVTCEQSPKTCLSQFFRKHPKLFYFRCTLRREFEYKISFTFWNVNSRTNIVYVFVPIYCSPVLFLFLFVQNYIYVYFVNGFEKRLCEQDDKNLNVRRATMITYIKRYYSDFSWRLNDQNIIVNTIPHEFSNAEISQITHRVSG